MYKILQYTYKVLISDALEEAKSLVTWSDDVQQNRFQQKCEWLKSPEEMLSNFLSIPFFFFLDLRQNKMSSFLVSEFFIDLMLLLNSNRSYDWIFFPLS